MAWTTSAQTERFHCAIGFQPTKAKKAGSKEDAKKEQRKEESKLIQSLPKRHFVEWPNWEREFPTRSLSQLFPAGGLDASDDYFYYNGSLTLPNTTTLTTSNTIVHNTKPSVVCSQDTNARFNLEGKGSKKRKQNKNMVWEGGLVG